jgi:MoaA/NifB/PqqE/SkfB family radical SAM enzyme
MTTKTSKYFVLRGLDDFSSSELEDFWRNYNPKTDYPKILSIGLSCTNRCNLRCVYCYAGEKRLGPGELTLSEQMDIVLEARDMGAKTVVICGDAEPMMDRNIIPIVEHNNHLGMTTVVVTNGTVIGDDRLCHKVHGYDGMDTARTLYENGASFMVKMDSIDPVRYDGLVGIPGAHMKFQNALERLGRAGFNRGEKRGEVTVTRIAFSGVITKRNLDEIPAMRSFADSFSAQFICKLPTLVGRALENMDIMFGVEKYDQIRAYLLKYTAKRETLMIDTPRCVAWHYGPVISIKGEMRECYTSEPESGMRIGNIRERSLFELMKIRNQKYDITCNDFCPVKTRINKELLSTGKEQIWKVLPENMREETRQL